MATRRKPEPEVVEEHDHVFVYNNGQTLCEICGARA